MCDPFADSEKYHNIQRQHMRSRGQRNKFLPKHNTQWIEQTYAEIHNDAELTKMLQRFPLLRQTKDEGKMPMYFESSRMEASDEINRRGRYASVKNLSNRSPSIITDKFGSTQRLSLYKNLKMKATSQDMPDYESPSTPKRKHVSHKLHKQPTLSRTIKARESISYNIYQDFSFQPSRTQPNF